MRFLPKLSLIAFVLLFAGCDSALKTVEREQAETKRKLDALGEPMLNQTVPKIGYMTMPRFTLPNREGEVESGRDITTKWIQVDLGTTQSISQIAMIPVQMDWRLIFHHAYHFPRRFKLQISDDPEFADAFTVLENQNFPDPGITPVVMSVEKRSARYLRLTIYGDQASALAEIMILNAKRNVAIGCPVVFSAGAAYSPPRWDSTNLVDGMTPLGPPILHENVEYDGLYAGPPDNDAAAWMQLDLGSEMPVEEVRLYPMHGRHGIDLPGFRFPEEFRIELSSTPDFSAPNVVFQTESFPNPGNNTVTIPTKNARGRYVRVVMEGKNMKPSERRFGLTELEVYSDGENVARKGKVELVKAPYGTRKGWPTSILNDGYTAYGRIIELPEWLDNWVQRKALNEKLEELNRRQVVLLGEAARRQAMLSGAIGALFCVGIYLVVRRARKMRRRDLEVFRKQLAQDLHDEIGSNLAAIGVISETAADMPVPPGSEQWERVSQIARETTDSMRETLWLVGGSEEVGIDLMKHLQLAASRMLPGLKVEWMSVVPSLPLKWPVGARRQVFLFFKETLANVVRHSKADSVWLSAKLSGGYFELEIRDNGQGFSTQTARGGIGLRSLRDRANRLKGEFQLDSKPGEGTRVYLRVKAGDFEPGEEQ